MAITSYNLSIGYSPKYPEVIHDGDFNPPADFSITVPEGVSIEEVKEALRKGYESLNEAFQKAHAKLPVPPAQIVDLACSDNGWSWSMLSYDLEIEDLDSEFGKSGYEEER